MTYGVFEPLLEERSYDVTEIEGAVPEGLRGSLYRNGPGRWQVGTTLLDCIFDGDGMVSRFTFDQGRITFRNRYLDTPQYRAKRRWRAGVGTSTGIPMPPANTANTSLSFHAGDLMALWEGGKPTRIDPDTLETYGLHDFGGRLKGLGMWSAHPRFDPATGEMFNFGLKFLPTPGFHCYKTDREGRTSRIASVRVKGLPWTHDFGLTERHLVFVLGPATPNVGQILRGRSAVSALHYRPEQPTRFLLVPRDGGEPRIAEHAATMGTHITNAYEDGTDTVVEVVRYPDFTLLKADLRNFRERFHLTRPNSLARYRITPTRVIEEQLTDHPCELPQFDWRRSTRRHRYSYLSGCHASEGLFDAVLRVDHETEEVASHVLGDCVGEPVFVPRAPDSAEDDGWLLCVVYREADHRSGLAILDARSLDLLATAWLPHHIPYGFHGIFTERLPGS
ncbi:carotenoid oxygenase family protein [Actinocorallia populi]|uniref:carotenoid oxygenase family protein n=1 Tax=Actinocorallia populi TaxID=2079200 RepID=UPI000D095AC3|nr:carotenoid oxygenase family protein [Actinocorallia populi]